MLSSLGLRHRSGVFEEGGRMEGGDGNTKVADARTSLEDEKYGRIDVADRSGKVEKPRSRTRMGLPLRMNVDFGD